MKKLTVFIEIPIGGGIRVHYENHTYIESYPTSITIQALKFVAYGCIPGTLNKADNEPIDAFILEAEDIPAGTTIDAFVIGMRFRNDGDHKLLMIANHSSRNQIQDISNVSKNILSDVGRWVEQTERLGERWGSYEEAKQWINQVLRN